MRLAARAMVMTLLALAASGCLSPGTSTSPSKPSPSPLPVSSPELASGAFPRDLTCDGTNRSPTVAWGEAQPATLSVVVELLDPDAPGRTFTHWLIYGDGRNPGNGHLESPPQNVFREGRNDFGKVGYGGPCPPRGSTHRYHLIVMALSFPLGTGTGGGELAAGFNKGQLDAAINSGKRSVVSRGEIVAAYRRS